MTRAKHYMVCGIAVEKPTFMRHIRDGRLRLFGLARPDSMTWLLAPDCWTKDEAMEAIRLERERLSALETEKQIAELTNGNRT